MNTDVVEIIEYYTNGNSLKACERQFNMSTYKIKKMLQSHNIKIRNRSEQLIIENIKMISFEEQIKRTKIEKKEL